MPVYHRLSQTAADFRTQPHTVHSKTGFCGLSQNLQIKADNRILISVCRLPQTIAHYRTLRKTNAGYHTLPHNTLTTTYHRLAQSTTDKWSTTGRVLRTNAQHRRLLQTTEDYYRHPQGTADNRVLDHTVTSIADNYYDHCGILQTTTEYR